jgi:hypothetical protein
MKFILNIMRVSPRTPAQVQTQPSPIVAATATPAPVAVATPRPPPSVESAPPKVVAAPSVVPSPTIVPTSTPFPPSTPALAMVSPTPGATKEPEVRRAEPLREEDLAKASAAPNSPASAPGGKNRVAIRPLRRTYIKVVVDNEARTPAFERWVSPSDGTVEFNGQHIDVRVLDREAVQIKKNGKSVAEGDSDVVIE